MGLIASLNSLFAYKTSDIRIGRGVHAFSPCIQKPEALRSLWGWGEPNLCNFFQDSQGYMVRQCLKVNEQTKYGYP